MTASIDLDVLAARRREVAAALAAVLPPRRRQLREHQNTWIEVIDTA